MFQISTVHAPTASLYPQIFLAHEPQLLKNVGRCVVVKKKIIMNEEIIFKLDRELDRELVRKYI